MTDRFRVGSAALLGTADYTGPGSDLPSPTIATIDERFPKGAAFADWFATRWRYHGKGRPFRANDELLSLC